MNSINTKKGIFSLFCFIILIFSILLIANIYAHGPQCAHGYGMQQSHGYGMQQSQGFHRGCGLSRGYGQMEGVRGPFGLNLQKGILQEPNYCKMLMDRQDLKLTSEQKDALRKLQIKHIKETSDLIADLQINKIELKKLRFSEKPDFNSLKAKLEKISKLQLELQLSRLQLQIDTDKILTQEQKDSLYLSPNMAVDIDWEEAMEEEVEEFSD